MIHILHSAWTFQFLSSNDCWHDLYIMLTEAGPHLRMPHPKVGREEPIAQCLLDKVMSVGRNVHKSRYHSYTYSASFNSTAVFTHIFLCYSLLCGICESLKMYQVVRVRLYGLMFNRPPLKWMILKMNYGLISREYGQFNFLLIKTRKLKVWKSSACPWNSWNVSMESWVVNWIFFGNRP